MMYSRYGTNRSARDERGLIKACLGTCVRVVHKDIVRVPYVMIRARRGGKERLATHIVMLVYMLRLRKGVAAHVSVIRERIHSRVVIGRAGLLYKEIRCLGVGYVWRWVQWGAPVAMDLFCDLVHLNLMAVSGTHWRWELILSTVSGHDCQVSGSLHDLARAHAPMTTRMTVRGRAHTGITKVSSRRCSPAARWEEENCSGGLAFIFGTKDAANLYTLKTGYVT
jgi:hypothetical protein